MKAYRKRNKSYTEKGRQLARIKTPLWVKAHPHISEYRAWKSMKERCYNPNNARFKDYGGRGIFVCQSWQYFPYFLEDMGTKPSSNYSLDRIDNNKGYFADNCKWSTAKEQANNRRNNVRLRNG